MLLSYLNASAQANWHWLQKLNSSGTNVRANSITTDKSGNSFITGQFSGTVSFGRTTLTSRGDNDLFLVKYNPGGKVMWASQIGRGPNPQPYRNYSASGADVSVDAAGNVYVAGNFVREVSYGNVIVPGISELNTTAMLAKFDRKGQVQWIQAFGIPVYSCEANAIATDAAGNSYITGRSDYGGIKFGNQTVGDSRRVMYVVRYTTSGAVSWAKVSSNFTTYGASGTDITLDGRGNCIVGGFFNYDMELGGKSLTTEGTSLFSDAFLASLSTASGDVHWLKQGGGTARIAELGADRQGNIYVAGTYSGSTSFGGQPLNSAGGSDAFLARYSRAGNAQWITSVGTSANESATGLTTDEQGYSTLIGWRTPSDPKVSSFIQSFQPDGDVYYAENLASSGDTKAKSIAQDQSGKLYLLGELSGKGSFGRVGFNVGSSPINFVARLHILAPRSGNNGGANAIVEVFPNPTSQRLVAELTWNKAGMLLAGQATLHNAMGAAVATQPLLAATSSQVRALFDCSKLPKGLYVLRIRTNDGTIYTKGVEVR
ncbi:hypothetical protein GCM10027346_21060 [Hymenobacter seoulensis]